MSDEGRIQRAAQFLFEERQAQRRYEPTPDTLAPRTVDEAYAVQEALSTLLAGKLGPLAGYKIGLTTAVMQQMVGLNEPIAGAPSSLTPCSKLLYPPQHRVYSSGY